MAMSRREFLELGVVGSAALMLPLGRVASARIPGRLPAAQLPVPFRRAFCVPPVLKPVRADATTDYYHLAMQQGTASIAPGLKTNIWGYNGISPGPTIRVRAGRETVVRQLNALPATHPTLGYRPSTSVHLHGSASLPEYDGYANDLTAPGQYKDYRYPDFQDARTLWYHDHAVMRTAEHVYMGLFGQYHLLDAHERSLPLPKGRYDIPLTIRDVMLDANGQLLFHDPEEKGVFGDINLVNGRPWPVMKVEQRKYRFRILNASVVRSYRWSLDSGQPFDIIATDAGLMPKPQRVKSFRHAPAERYEVVIDFSKVRLGKRVVLRNLSNENNIDYRHTDVVMAFDVVSGPTSKAGNKIPAELAPDCATMKLNESMAAATRQFQLVREHGAFTINERTWEDVVDSGFTFSLANPALDSVEVWEFVNPSGGWFHPLHIHLVDFRVLSRNGRPPKRHELGPKDVVYVGEHESVRVAARFGPHLGRYMIHCHNLRHEDHDMMGQFEVGTGGDDPINSAPAQWLPEGEL